MIHCHMVNDDKLTINDRSTSSRFHRWANMGLDGAEFLQGEPQVAQWCVGKQHSFKRHVACWPAGLHASYELQAWVFATTMCMCESLLQVLSCWRESREPIHIQGWSLKRPSHASNHVAYKPFIVENAANCGLCTHDRCVCPRGYHPTTHE